jgi:hypothetical protein
MDDENARESGRFLWEKLKLPSSACRHVHSRHPWRSPSGGFAVQIGNPADLSPASGRRDLVSEVFKSWRA